MDLTDRTGPWVPGARGPDGPDETRRGRRWSPEDQLGAGGPGAADSQVIFISLALTVPSGNREQVVAVCRQASREGARNLLRRGEVCRAQAGNIAQLAEFHREWVTEVEVLSDDHDGIRVVVHHDLRDEQMVPGAAVAFGSWA